MFVRLFVDENLDRLVPISKQPKEKINAIIMSCQRQFPEFGDRARKRIRTYLKSCRRSTRLREPSTKLSVCCKYCLKLFLPFNKLNCTAREFSTTQKKQQPCTFDKSKHYQIKPFLFSRHPRNHFLLASNQSKMKNFLSNSLVFFSIVGNKICIIYNNNVIFKF